MDRVADAILAGAFHEAQLRFSRRPTLPKLTPAQSDVLSHPARFKVICAGRRWGKSTTALVALVTAAASKRKGIYAWVFPIFQQGVRVGWQALKDACPTWEFNETQRRVRCPDTDSVIYILSAETPDTIRGISLDGVVIDEAAMIDEGVFYQVILPALGDREGWCIFASTPRGVTNWFFILFHRAREGWRSWRYTTSDNPMLPPGTVVEMQEVMTERDFREEVLAEFIEDSGTVFRRITDAATVERPDEPQLHQGHYKVMGVDWGRSHDFTVCTVLCVDCHKVVDWQRFNKIDFALQRERIKTLHAAWVCEHIFVESNSIGRPNYEALKYDDLPVYAFETTAQSKPPLIQHLVLAIERHEIDIPKDYVSELQAYQSTVNANTGKPTFGAPEGMFDDRVISLALANRARRYATGMGGAV